MERDVQGRKSVAEKLKSRLCILVTVGTIMSVRHSGGRVRLRINIFFKCLKIARLKFALFEIWYV